MTRSNHIPDCFVLEFKENENRRDTFDLNFTSTTFTKFKYFRLEQPKKDYLIKQGAKYVCQSWTKDNKSLHTGLIPIGIENYYFGDHTERRNGKKINSIMLFYFVPDTNTIRVYYFNQYSKTSIRMKMQFCRDYISNIT